MKPPCLLILNTNEDTVELLRLAFEEAGFVVISAFVDDVKRGESDLAPLVTQHRPKCVLFDVALPYDRQWRFGQHLRTTELLRDLPFVYTTTNVKRVREQVSTNAELIEIVGKPYDLQQIVDVVRRAIQPTMSSDEAISQTSESGAPVH